MRPRPRGGCGLPVPARGAASLRCMRVGSLGRPAPAVSLRSSRSEDVPPWPEWALAEHPVSSTEEGGERGRERGREEGWCSWTRQTPNPTAPWTPQRCRSTCLGPHSSCGASGSATRGLVPCPRPPTCFPGCRRPNARPKPPPGRDPHNRTDRTTQPLLTRPTCATGLARRVDDSWRGLHSLARARAPRALVLCRLLRGWTSRRRRCADS